MNESKHWYAVRATRGRAQLVYDSLCAIAAEYDVDSYLPIKSVITKKKDKVGNVSQEIATSPLLPSLLFVRCTERVLIQLRERYIPGFSLYYNHTISDGEGRNPLLVIPDYQFHGFRTIVEQANLDVIINQQVVPKFIKGDMVRVMDGPFKGVIGKVLKFKHQTRVFIEIKGLGTYGTAYVPKSMIEKIPDPDE